MSNPGVIFLSGKLIKKSYYWIEDNIGESIHLHIDNFRFDLTINQFFALQRALKKAVDELYPNKEILTLLNTLDPTFLNAISQWLYDLDFIDFKKIRLSKIKCQTNLKNGDLKYKSLTKSRILMFLRNDKRFYRSYQQENHPFQSNDERLRSVLDCIKKYGYPYNNNFIVLFNNQNFIMDGQHRAACLYYLYGDIEVDVMVMHFKHPELMNIKKPNFKTILKKKIIRIKRLAKHLLKIFRKN